MWWQNSSFPLECFYISKCLYLQTLGHTHYVNEEQAILISRGSMDWLTHLFFFLTKFQESKIWIVPIRTVSICFAAQYSSWRSPDVNALGKFILQPQTKGYQNETEPMKRHLHWLVEILSSESSWLRARNSRGLSMLWVTWFLLCLTESCLHLGTSFRIFSSKLPLHQIQASYPDIKKMQRKRKDLLCV